MYAKKILLGLALCFHILVTACSHVGTEPELLEGSDKRPCEPFEICDENRHTVPSTTAVNSVPTRSLEPVSPAGDKVDNSPCQSGDEDCIKAKKPVVNVDTEKAKGADGAKQANALTAPTKIASRPVGVPAVGTEYLIGPGDQVQIYVWRNPEVSTSVPVRPDGKITTPLVEDMVAVGKTPTQLARDIEKVLGAYIRDPVVSVIVAGFGGPYSQQIRVVGQAAKPQTLPYKENMSLLDVMIAVGGLTEFAAGNKATIVRVVKDKQKHIQVRLDNLIKKGDISANVAVLPGDILIIPESWF